MQRKRKAIGTDSELPRDVSGLPKGFIGLLKGFIGLRGLMQVSAELQWTQQRGYTGSFAAVSVVPFAAVSVVPFAALSVVPFAAVSVRGNTLCINALANCLWAKITIDKCLIH